MGLLFLLKRYYYLYKTILLIILALAMTNCNQKVQFETIKREKLDTPREVSHPPFEVEVPEEPEQPYIPPPKLPPNYLTENFSFHSESSKIDILFIVDNSPSMYEEQNKLGERIRNFVGTLRNIDWQIGITTTDVSNGNWGLKGDLLTIHGTNKNVLTPRDEDYEEKFLKTVVREETKDCMLVCPSSDEQPLSAINMAIDKATTRNYELFRNDADFVVIVLSDEDERSTGPYSATQPDEVIQKVNTVFPNKMFTAYGVILEPGDSQCFRDQGNGEYGDFVAELAEKTGGATSSICDNNYAQGLTKIGQRVNTIANAIQLTKEPVAGSVKLEITPYAELRYQVNGNKIVFAEAPQSGTEIKVTYEAKQ